MNKAIALVFSIFLTTSLYAYNSDTIIVNDTANVLHENEKKEILQVIDSLRSDLGTEIAILIVNNTKNKAIEEYSSEYFENNKLGSKNKLDGLLLVISLETRQVRIEVGYGLEKIIKDDVAGKIIREILVPNLKSNKYAIGVLESIKNIDYRIRSNPELIGDIKGIKVN